MNARIAALNDRQAIEALVAFYAHLPAEAWADSQKPQNSDLKFYAEELRASASMEVKAVALALTDDKETPRQGEAARLILARFGEADFFKPYLDAALAESVKAHMAVPLVAVGGLILLLGLVADVDVKIGSKFKFHFGVKDPKAIGTLVGSALAALAGLVPKGPDAGHR